MFIIVAMYFFPVFPTCNGEKEREEGGTERERERERERKKELESTRLTTILDTVGVAHLRHPSISSFHVRT